VRVTRDLWPGVVVAAAGLFFLIHLLTAPAVSETFGVGPLTLPTALAALLTGLGTMLALGAVRRRAPASEPAPAPSPAEEAGQADIADQAAEARRWPGPRVLALLVLGLVYTAALPWLGYYVASVLFTGALAWLLGSRSPIMILLLMFLAPLALLMFFERFMNILLPSSRLFG
jgi:hypothetical protein